MRVQMAVKCRCEQEKKEGGGGCLYKGFRRKKEYKMFDRRYIIASY